MNDYKIVIDAGHGGEDIGNNENGIVEKDWTLQISKYIHERLDELGIENVLLRDDDSTLSDEQRVDKINQLYGNNDNVIVISNQLNNGGNTGSEIVYALRNNDTLARLIANNLEQNGQKVNKYYQRRLPTDLSKDYFYIIRETPKQQTIFLEYGYVDSNDDIAVLKNNWQSLAEAVVKSIATYTKSNYNPVVTDDSYVVVSGDTLYSIARKYNMTVNELKQLNNLTSNTLNIGQVLKIKDSNTLDKIDNNTYIVKSGDTLYSIANRYNTTVDALKNLNNLSSNNLSIGQVLKIPTKSEGITYVVKKGDNLYQIANKYNTTVDMLKSLNNLSSNALSIGQILKIPGDNVVYVVKSGDTLYSIANKYNTSVNDIKKLNNLSNNSLSIGQKLKIPS